MTIGRYARSARWILPFIKSDITDGSFTAGVKGEAQGWKWDLGTVYGRNSFRVRFIT
jgi:hypothetical protein